MTLPLARYRLEFEVKTPLHLPAYAGSALRAASCMTRQPACDGCPLLATCPYAAIFETRPPARTAWAAAAIRNRPIQNNRTKRRLISATPPPPWGPGQSHPLERAGSVASNTSVRLEP
jgi:hypothetical protein